MKSPKAKCLFVGEQFGISSRRWEPAIYYKSFKTAVLVFKKLRFNCSAICRSWRPLSAYCPCYLI